MSNNLTHALAAAGLQCVLNAVIGQPLINANIFLAGIIAMMINLDKIESMSGSRSPVGHSVGFALIWIYVTGCCCYLADMFGILNGETVLGIILAVVSAFVTHLLLDSCSSEGIYGLPKSGDPNAWFADVREDKKAWCGWGRITLATKISAMSDGKLNLGMLAVLLIFISLAPT